MIESTDDLSDEQLNDLAELAAMLKTAKDENERREIRKTMAEIIDPSRLGEIIFHRPRKRKKK